MHQVRPQKLQKTSVSERQQPITRFDADKLPFKDARTHHHQKLPSPVKSPKSNTARKRPSKLIDAATRILEPGLQTTSSKCALTYSNTLQCPPKQVNVGDSCACRSAVVERESSCRNCGCLLDSLNGERKISAKPSVFASCHHQLEDEFHNEYQAFMYSDIGRAQPHVKCTCRLPLGANNLKNRKGPGRLSASNLMNSKASTCISRMKNRSSSHSGFDNGRCELEKRMNNSMNESVVAIGRKRRPSYFSRQGENSSTTFKKPIIGSPRIVGVKHNDRDGLLWQQKTRGHQVCETEVRSSLYCDEGEEPALVESGGKTKFGINGDAVSALVEKKLKELGPGNASKKTTAMILEELITALKTDVSLQQDNLPSSVSDSHVYNTKPSIISEGNTTMSVKPSN